jgi:hypothetical protein
MEIVVEQKRINLDNKIITELENFHKNSGSLYNHNCKSAFNVISVKDVNDVLKTNELFNRLNIKVLKNKDKFLEKSNNNPINNTFLIKEGNEWKIQSDYIGSGMNVEDLEKCVNFITQNSNVNEIKDFTKERVISRIKELKKGKKLYDDNEKLSAGPKNHYKASYSKDGHNFWKISKFIIEELENLIDK